MTCTRMRCGGRLAGRATKLLVFAVGVALLLAPDVFLGSANACSRSSPISIPKMLDEADLIVTAFPLRYLREPGDVRTTGKPESLIVFRIQSVLKGKAPSDTLCLNGYLGDRDDYNDHPVPYSFVRPGGRAGSCFANTYKHTAQFLLVLKQTPGGYTVDWEALAPVNEQLRSDQDPWLLWVMGFLAGRDENFSWPQAPGR
jgi:hypothetical protein